MTRKNYIVNYTVKAINGVILKSGTMKVKNKSSEFEAKVKFEEWLRKKHPNFGALIIHNCRPENFFDDIFGGSNPFGFKF